MPVSFRSEEISIAHSSSVPCTNGSLELFPLKTSSAVFSISNIRRVSRDNKLLRPTCATANGPGCQIMWRAGALSIASEARVQANLLQEAASGNAVPGLGPLPKGLGVDAESGIED